MRIFSLITILAAINFMPLLLSKAFLSTRLQSVAHLKFSRRLLSSSSDTASVKLTNKRLVAEGATLDTLLISQHPELVISHAKARRSDPKIFEEIIPQIAELRKKRNALILETDHAKNIRKVLSLDIGKLMKEKNLEQAEELKKKVAEANEISDKADTLLAEIDNELKSKLSYLPNLLDDRVPDGDDDKDNVQIHSWGDDLRKIGSDYKWHDEIAVRLNGLDVEAASRIAGARFSVLVGNIAKLERALIQYFLDFHAARGYLEVSVPLIVSRSTLEGTGQLPKFEDDLFKVSHSVSGEDAFLIPTAEVPVTNLYKDQILNSTQLPIYHVSCTPCFRAEAGSYGRDTRGLLRQHQFYKVELVKIVSPESSSDEHEKMTIDAEDILKSLGLPFRRMLLCSGDIGFSARICYDLEVWLPAQQCYREISSISNCYDFQSRRMSLRLRETVKGKKVIVNPHTLNGSGVAVGRALVAILENHQQPDGSVLIPECLQHYMGGMKVLSAGNASKLKYLRQLNLKTLNPVDLNGKFSTKVDSFLSGSNSVYVEQMFELWQKDPNSVHASWSSYFKNLEAGIQPEEAFISPPSIVSGGLSNLQNKQAAAIASTPVVSDSLGLSYLIRAYQDRGHEAANLDPLGIHAFRTSIPSELDHKFHGFTDADLDRKLNLLGTSSGGNTGFLDILGSRPNITLRQVITNLQKTYCSNLGVEYMHMGSKEKCNWIRSQVETPKWMSFNKDKKLHIYERLCFADHFEKFLANKFNTAKRFGLEGGESSIPGLKYLIDRGSELGIESFVFGMPHRGRLNVLANVMRKPMPQIFKEFQGTHYDLDAYMKDDWSSHGDVKYHLGTSMDRSYPDGRRVHLSLVANPSHLEAVNPVVIGKTRAKQFLTGNKDTDKKKHMSVLLHGDAAFAGQGCVYETMQMSRVEDYAVGGTVHVIINNQVGFTTDPKESRSTLYASDLGKAFNIPIFHCNGDDPLSVVTAFEMAIEWRQHFGEDCIIDLICYRRYGHNELDQPMYTQPQLYSKISKHPDTLTVYGKQLLSEGAISKAELDDIRFSVNKILESEFEASKSWITPPHDWLSSRWGGFLSPRQRSRIRETGVTVDKLREIGIKLCTLPADFNVHKQLEKIFNARLDTIIKGVGIDWATAESLAFGTLLLEGNHIRLSGQDVQRGTFSHRHAVIIDQVNGSNYVPANHLAKHVLPAAPLNKTGIPDSQAEFTCRNSILSEFGVLGFEMGYSLENPNVLTIWEAQFGDFVNGAQIMIDQFISAGEDKWLRQSGLTLMLPHGYMGQGAEHSSCRVERFLQQVDEDSDVVPAMGENERMQIQKTNWQVVNCTTPANYYHVLRRQIHRDFRKPLILVTPKNLLRDKKSTSSLNEMGEGTRFKRVYREANPDIWNNPSKVDRIIFCSGKLYYELVDEREKHNLTNVAIIRIEQLAPFPWDKVARECAYYDKAVVVWCQEEPKNMGAWSFVMPRICTATKSINGNERRPLYAGRSPSAATATGLGARAHNAEQDALIQAAFTIKNE